MWVPHCTLAMNVAREQIAAVSAAATLQMPIDAQITAYGLYDVTSASTLVIAGASSELPALQP